MQQAHGDRPGRPFAVTLLALVVLILSAAHLIGLYAALTRWSTYNLPGLSLPLWVLATLDGLWGVLWLVMALALWLRLAWARPASLIAFPLYTLIFIGRQIVYVAGDYERGRLPFIIGLVVLLNLLIVFMLTRPRVCRAFQRHQPERETEET